MYARVYTFPIDSVGKCTECGMHKVGYIQMDIFFQDKKLRQLADDERKCKKELGDRRAILFLRRISDMYTVESLEELRAYPGHYHELREDRKGQWACDLDHPYRLIFTPHETPIPTDPNGRYIWIEIKSVEIVEIVDYHSK